MFTLSFLNFLIYGSLIGTSLAVIIMLFMLYKDYREDKLW